MLQWVSETSANVTKKYPRQIVRSGYAIERALMASADILDTHKEIFGSVVSFISFEVLVLMIPGIIPGYLYLLGVATNYWNSLVPYNVEAPREVVVVNNLMSILLSTHMDGERM